MVAILGGLGAATAWAVATLCSARSTRMVGAGPVLAGVMLTGSVIVLPLAVLDGVPDDHDGGLLTWLAVAGLGNVVGLLLAYSALRIGKVGIVAPIVSTEGAVAAVIAIAAGESVRPGTGVTLAVIAGGIGLAAAARDRDAVQDGTRRWAASLTAAAAAVCFGVGLYATARVSADLSVVWALVPARLAGVLLVALPLALTSRLRLTRRALPLVIIAGLAEVAGFACFAVASRHGVAVSAVLASQFAALAAVGAFLLFGERLTRVQLAGVATIVAGVAVLGGIEA